MAPNRYESTNFPPAPRSAAEVRLELLRLAPEIQKRLKQPPSAESHDFFANAVETLRGIRGSSNIDARIESLFDCAQYYYYSGGSRELFVIIRVLDDLAKRTTNGTWKRKIAMIGGVHYADIGNTAEAFLRICSAVEIARANSDLAGEIIVLCNMAVAFVYSGLYKEGIPCLERALKMAVDNREIVHTISLNQNVHHFECIALINLAQMYHYMGDNQAALRISAQCLRLTPTPTSSIDATSYLLRGATYAGASLDLGFTVQARSMIDRCMDHWQIAGTRGRFMIDLVAARCEIQDGNAEAGIAKLEELAMGAGEITSMKLPALKALAKAYDDLDRPEQALRYVDELIAILHDARMQSIDALLAARDIGAGPRVSEAENLGALKLARATYETKVLRKELVHARVEVLERLAVTADLKEDASGGHGHRVGALAALFAAHWGWPKDECYWLMLAGRLHDIGKIGLPDRILFKPETLKSAERQFVLAHTRIGAEILASSMGESHRMAQDVAKFHHEHWDGSGYPLGIAGDRIPESARIVALADAFDAMTHGRPYSPTLTAASALDEISANVGSHFDPRMGPAFVAFMRELCITHPDLDQHLGKSEQYTAFSTARRRIQALIEEGARSTVET